MVRGGTSGANFQFPGGTEEYQESPSGQSVSRPILVPDITEHKSQSTSES